MKDYVEELFDSILAKGKSALDEFISSSQAENIYLDFKRSANDGKTFHLENNDKNNYAAAVSGFGNSDGGLIVWGVDCKPNKIGEDVITDLRPLENAKRFATLLNKYHPSATYPIHRSVRNEAISDNGGDSGYVISHIPASEYAPLACMIGKDSKFYIRAGESFVLAPYNVLAGMFGRRPQPKLNGRINVSRAEFHNGGLNLDFSIRIENKGRAVSRDTFFNLEIENNLDMPSRVNYQGPSNRWNWVSNNDSHIFLHLTKDNLIPPTASTHVLHMSARFIPPFGGNLSLAMFIGCDGSIPISKTIVLQKERLEKVFTEHGHLKDLGDDLKQILGMIFDNQIDLDIVPAKR